MDLRRPPSVLHWNYRGFTEFPLRQLQGEENEITDIYLKENLISIIPNDISRLHHLESLYLSGNDIKGLPKEIGYLQCLKCLDLSGNQLVALPEEIGDVRNLKYLILDDNELRELPLRIVDLRRLQYLSVCDNNLTWLPQRPVYNYYHCELRFWRNRKLKCIPYSLWYHMFRNEQIRSLDIGCLGVAEGCAPVTNGCVFKLHSHAFDWKIEITLPQYKVFKGKTENPPTLHELCKRHLYETIANQAKSNLDKKLHGYSHFYADKNTIIDNTKRKSYRDVNCNEIHDDDNNANNTDDNRISNGLEVTDNNNSNNFANNVTVNEDINDLINGATSNKEQVNVVNGDNNKVNNKDDCSKLTLNIEKFIENIKGISLKFNDELVEKIKSTRQDKETAEIKSKLLDTASSIVHNEYDFLPEFIKKDLRNGPISRCENIMCKKVVFDDIAVRFCLGEILLIDSTVDAILSALFCSNSCAEKWSQTQQHLLPFTIIYK